MGKLLGTKSQGHQKELQSEKIVNFDMLIINLYPFEETINKTKKSDEIIEMIDIGGHSLIRAAIKNYTKTTPVVSPADYKQIIRKLPYSKIEKKKYAVKALQHITQYDIAITGFKELELMNIHYGMVKILNKKLSHLLMIIVLFKSAVKKLSYNNLRLRCRHKYRLWNEYKKISVQLLNIIFLAVQQ